MTKVASSERFNCTAHMQRSLYA